MRVSMHPGQYTVLNSIRNDVVEKALNDLQYHCRFLDALGCDETCKVILHIGGIYSDKKAATERFVSNYRDLDGQIKKRLVIENDDKSYNIRDVLMISDQTGVPVVFDNLHHNLNNIPGLLSEYDLIDQCRGTWSQIDGKQKIHYSQQSERGIRGAHSDSIKSCDFVEFYNGLHSKDVDIMLEVKDKNLSAKKCILLTVDNLKIRSLEEEWARYKYYVLSRSVLIYNEIRNLLKNKIHPDVSEFYALIEETSAYGEDRGAQINAALHVWGHVNSDVGDKIKIRFKKLIDEYAEGTKTLKSIKKLLHKLAEEQSETYLLNSLYFYI